MPNKLFARLRMNAVRQPREPQRRDFAGQTQASGKFALPLALHGVALLVIALRLGRELTLVIALRLAGAERFGNGKHWLKDPRSGLDTPMILFDQIVQVFRRSQLGALPCLVFVWNFTRGSMRSGITIKRDADRCAQLRAKRFAEKALAAATSRFGLSRKSTVLPSRSTRDTGRPNGHGTFRYVSSTCHERPLLRA